MTQDHDRADGDRLLGARLSGIALRHARWGGLTEAEKAAGAAELTEVARDRGDLLAEVAGLMLGSAAGRGPEYEARGQAVVELCRMAGADETLIPQWTEQGRRRAEVAQLPRSAGRAVHHADPEPIWPGGPVPRAQAAPWCLRRHDLQRPLRSPAGDTQARTPDYRHHPPEPRHQPARPLAPELPIVQTASRPLR
jgi:hypothetical protein